MVSGYQAREFGFGLRDLLTDDLLKEVNMRREGKRPEASGREKRRHHEGRRRSTGE